MLISLCIGLFLPIILAWIFRASFKTWNRFKNPDHQFSLLSRLSGAVLSLTWGMAIIIITVLLMAMMPPVNPTIKFIFNDIHTSKLYKTIKPFDSSAIDKKTAKENIKALSEDKRIQDIVNDPAIVDAINRKDYAALMNNPKITSLMQDPELLKKMMSIYQDIGQQPLP